MEKTIQEMTNDVKKWQTKHLIKDNLRDFLDINIEKIEMISDDCLYYDISPLIIFRNSGADKKINFFIRVVIEDTPFLITVYHNGTCDIEEQKE